MGEMVQPQYYMKGRGRHLLWPALVMILFQLLMQLGFTALQVRLFHAAGYDVTLAVSLALEAALFVGWAAVLVLYAVMSSMKPFRALFAVLACGTLLSLVSGSLSAFWLLSMISGKVLFPGLHVLNTAGALLGVLAGLVWAVCLLVMAFSRKAGLPLKLSAILLALLRLFMIAFMLSDSFLAQFIVSRFSGNAYTTIYLVINIITGIAYLGLSVFFFAALSFSRQKPPKAAVAAVATPTV